MSLNEFLDDLFGCLTDQEGIDNIKKCVRENVEGFREYDKIKVEHSVHKDEETLDCTLSITSDAYDDGEVVFMDCYLD